MPQPPTIFPKPHVSVKLPDALSATSTLVTFPSLRPSQHAGDSISHQQLFRTKRKHVLKACDRCRVKKTKVQLSQTLSNAMETNHAIAAQHIITLASFAKERLPRPKHTLEGEAALSLSSDTFFRNANESCLSYRFVEMLESHHALVVKALQQLYAHCINNKCFPGEPIDVVDGYPLTHAILDRLGLIKEAEESTSEGLDTDTIETSQYWRPQRRSSSSIDTEYASSMQTSPVERSPISDSTSESPTSESHRGPPLTSLQGIYSSYGPYHCPDEQAWPMDATAQVMEFTHPTATTGIQVETQYLPAPTSAVGPTSTICHDNSTSHLAIGNTTGPTSAACGHTGYTGPFPSISSFAYQHSGDGTQGADQQYEWAPNLWDRSKSGQPPNVE
ncbi:hypothetical protein LOZ66_004110 [Ophidiomyces ophidiicola]|nr:hypothetical protein LOZ66_004110 [Ophidiomyces ophidiicola]